MRTTTGRARILVEHPLGYVSAVGDARVIVGAPAHSIQDRIGVRYLTESGRRDFRVPDDAALELTPTTWTVSDMTKTSIPSMLRNNSFDEISGWFNPYARRDQ